MNKWVFKTQLNMYDNHFKFSIVKPLSLLLSIVNQFQKTP